MTTILKAVQELESRRGTPAAQRVDVWTSQIREPRRIVLAVALVALASGTAGLTLALLTHRGPRVGPQPMSLVVPEPKVQVLTPTPPPASSMELSKPAPPWGRVAANSSLKKDDAPLDKLPMNRSAKVRLAKEETINSERPPQRRELHPSLTGAAPPELRKGRYSRARGEAPGDLGDSEGKPRKNRPSPNEQMREVKAPYGKPPAASLGQVEASSSPQVGTPRSSAPGVAHDVPERVPEPVNAAWKARPPEVPLTTVSSVSAAPRVEVKSIVYSPKLDKCAVTLRIDGAPPVTLHQGESTNGIEVQLILRDAVYLRNGATVFVVGAAP